MPPLFNQNGLTLNSDVPNANMSDKSPLDTIPNLSFQDAELDEDDLASRILELMKNDIADKQQMGWIDKRNYDVKAYYGLKDAAISSWPWPNSSNFPVPLTPTLLDTAHANIMASIFNNPNGPVKVNEVSVEDIRTAKNLQDLMNWQALGEINIEKQYDRIVFRTFLHGTGFAKVYWDININAVRVASIDISNIFLPIDAQGMGVEDTDHIIQIVPLSWNDLQLRKAFNVYKHPDEILPGDFISSGAEAQQKLREMDIATGTSMRTRNTRDNYFIAEVYLTYYPKNGSAPGGGRTGAGARPQELIVWISPNGGMIQRIKVNTRKVRPFAEHIVYPNPDRFYGLSLPEKIRNIQEKLDYADKQNTDALDKAITPAMFVDETSQFDASSSQRVPGGIYPKGRGNTVDFEPSPPIERGFERQIPLLWEQAERLTGLIDITQGRASSFGGKTLGEVEIRTTRADIRFSTLYHRFEQGWSKIWNLIYQYDNEYMDRKKKIRVLGYSNIQSIDEIFPPSEGKEMASSLGLGLLSNPDFNFAGAVLADQENENQKIIAFTNTELQNPLVVGDKGNLWRLTEMRANAFGIKNLETVIQKPKEANTLSVEEFIQRVLSGQKEVTVSPGIDTVRYIFELKLFVRTETFADLSDAGKKAILDGLRHAFVMSVAEKRAQLDVQMITQGQKMEALRAKLGGALPQQIVPTSQTPAPVVPPPATPEALGL